MAQPDFQRVALTIPNFGRRRLRRCRRRSGSRL